MSRSAIAAAKSGDTRTPNDGTTAIREAILSGPIVPTLLRLALPTITVLVAQTMVGIAETFYVSWLGTDALVGVSVVFPIWMLMTMMSAGGIGSGVASAVARAIGSRRERDANEHVFHAVVLAAVIGVTFEIGMRILGPTLFSALGAKGGALTQAMSYSNWLFPCAVPIWIVNLCSAALRGAGNVKTPALVTLVGAVVLIPLSPLFIFGLGGFHGFGVAGAGLAVTTYYCGACVVLLRYLGTGRAGLTLAPAPLQSRLLGESLGVGIMSSIAALQLNLAVILVTGAMGRFGTAALAGYGMGSRLDYLFIPVLFGLGTSALTMVGSCIGAGDLARAKRIAVAGTMLAAVGSECVGLIVAVFPIIWLGIFSRNPQVLHAGATYLRAVAPFYAAMAATFMLAFVSQGAGRPLWTTLAGTVRLVIAAGVGWFAVAYWHAGLPGLSLIVASGQVASAGLSLLALQLGLVWPQKADASPAQA